MTGTVEGTRRMIGTFVPPRSVLRRRSDTIEVAARWVLLLVGLLGVPVALACGSAVAADLAPRVAIEQAERHVVSAEVLAVPRAGGGSLTDTEAAGDRAPVRWIGADGLARVHEVRVPANARPGDHRAVWVDREDRPTTAPMATGRPSGQGFLTALVILAGDLAVSLLLLAGLRWVLDRRRLRQWDAAWRRFTGPDHESLR